jgi:membrane associated rhomboid family serine protease
MADETVAWVPGSTDPKIAFAEFKLHLREITPRLYVVPAVVALNVLVLAIMVATGVSVSNPTVPQLLRWGADYGPLTLGGQPWRLGTNVFVHLGVIHLLANMAALLSSGAVVERLFGPLAFAALYLAAGITGSLASTVIHPLVVSAGASGAIFGVYGALGALVLLQRGAIPSVVLSKLGGVAGSFIVYNILFGAAHAGIDNIAHLGGLIGGAAAGALLIRPLIPGRSEAAGRPALVAAGSLALGLGAALVLPRPLSYESIVRDFEKGEEAALAPYNVAVGQLGRHEIGMEDVANQIELGILPGWRKTRAALERQTGQFLARPKDAPPKLQLALELLDQTAVAREEGWTQMVVALRAGDKDRLAAASNGAKEKVERVYQELEALQGD